MQLLYESFINHTGDGKVIIATNFNVMPEIDFDAVGVKVTTYYKDGKDGQEYGFCQVGGKTSRRRLYEIIIQKIMGKTS